MIDVIGMLGEGRVTETSPNIDIVVCAWTEKSIVK